MIDTTFNNVPHSCVLELKSRRGCLTFHRVVTLTSAAASTAVQIITDDEVPAGYRVYILSFLVKVKGATTWVAGGVSNVYIGGNDAPTLSFINIAVAALSANAQVGLHSANITYGTMLSQGAGGADGYGLQVVGDATGTGSDLAVQVYGLVAPAQLTNAQYAAGTASVGGDQPIR